MCRGAGPRWFGSVGFGCWRINSVSAEPWKDERVGGSLPENQYFARPLLLGCSQLLGWGLAWTGLCQDLLAFQMLSRAVFSALPAAPPLSCAIFDIKHGRAIFGMDIGLLMVMTLRHLLQTSVSIHVLLAYHKCWL